MVKAETTRVVKREYDRNVLNDHSLKQRLDEATDFFEREYAGIPTDDQYQDVTVHWSLEHTEGQPVVVATVDEHTSGKLTFSVRKVISLRETLSKSSLEVYMLRMLGQFAAKQYDFYKTKTQSIMDKLVLEDQLDAQR
jgi:hypothetical protein